MMTNRNKKSFGEVHYVDDNDAGWIIDSILKEKTVLSFIKFFNLQMDVRHYIDMLTSLKTVTELQTDILVPVFAQIFEKTTERISCSNIEMISRNQAAAFVSNHRDIVLDSAVMNMMLYKNGFRFASAGIGDNLLMNEAVQIFFNMMKCFVIKRSLSGKKQILFLRDLSEFIHYCVTERHESIWIAQTSGRAKNGDDRTNPAIVKMLAMSNREDSVGRLKALNIHTTACSYEWDPCDIFKVNELLVQDRGQTYVKKPNEDMISIHAGICEPKGRVHVTFNRISEDELESCRELNDRERYFRLAAIIDAKIHSDYKLWPSNYIAADLLQLKDTCAGFYSSEEKTYFVERMEKRLSRYQGDDAARAKQLFLTMYANPVFNKPGRLTAQPTG